MRGALTIAGKDLRQRFRDRSALVLGFVAPLLIAGLMSLAFRQADNFHFTAGVVDHDGGAIAAGFVDVLHSDQLHDVLTAKSFPDEAAASSALKSGDVRAVFVLPAGMSTAMTGNAPVDIRVLTSVDYQLAGQVATSIATSFVAQLQADRLSVATALVAGAPADQLAALAQKAATLRLPASVVNQPSGSRALKAISYYAPGMGIFFLLFAVSFGSRGYFIELRNGTIERMQAAVSPGQIVLGKALSVFVYGLASLATMALLTSLAFGADWGGPVPASLLCTAMVIAVVCLTALVTVVARTERQAEGFSSIVVFTLALLGGNFVLVSASPPLLRRLALYTPNGWAMRGFVDLATGPHTLDVVWTPVLAMLAFSAVVAAVTVGLSRRVLAP